MRTPYRRTKCMRTQHMTGPRWAGKTEHMKGGGDEALSRVFQHTYAYMHATSGWSSTLCVMVPKVFSEEAYDSRSCVRELTHAAHLRSSLGQLTRTAPLHSSPCTAHPRSSLLPRMRP